MELVFICGTAALASLLTFFTGFGLATVLTPVMLLFFPAPIAIALTAIVHFLNNVFKYLLTRHHIDWRTVLRFGLPAGIGALGGAALLHILPGSTDLTSYAISGKLFHVTALKLVVGCLMICFALFETIPRLRNLQFSENKISLGGALSGFFGGLSGHQGALRSAFLVRSGLGKDTFIATGIAIACIVDISRLVVYRPFGETFDFQSHAVTVIAATLAAFAGAFAGNLLLKKVTITGVQKIVALAIVLLGTAIATGII